MTYDKPKPEIIKLEFPKEDQEYIDCMIAGKPTPDLIQFWTDNGMDIEYKTKCLIRDVMQGRTVISYHEEKQGEEYHTIKK